jgi:hypothetical protein
MTRLAVLLNNNNTRFILIVENNILQKKIELSVNSVANLAFVKLCLKVY